ncbi:hypothetical protein LZC95_42180 [Pendulispora brunnea]|uniref:Uncharacterized protein n=1 Tax=Pendulispora brunnea TaxID=2905690 RepID=A0ABZ2K4N2_9BACT
MRLGFLGPILSSSAGASGNGSTTPLETASSLLLGKHRVGRAIYLGADDALEHMVEAWARRLVGDDPTDDAAWRRAAQLAANGTPEDIDAFVKGERMRLRLRSLESLPHRILRTMEMVGDRIAILIHDKELLDEEDIFAASLLIYGKSDVPLVRKIGGRFFITPGMLGPRGGICVLDDTGDEIAVAVYNIEGEAVLHERLALPRASRPRAGTAPQAGPGTHGGTPPGSVSGRPE